MAVPVDASARPAAGRVVATGMVTDLEVHESSSRRRTRTRRWPIWTGLGLLSAVVLLGVVFLILLLVTPSTRDAPRRVQAILAAHSSPSNGGAIPGKVAAALL